MKTHLPFRKEEKYHGDYLAQVKQITSQRALDEDEDGKIEQLEQYTLPILPRSFLQRNSQIKPVDIADHQR